MRISHLRRLTTGHYQFNMTIEGGVTLRYMLYRPETGAVMPAMTFTRGRRTKSAFLNPARIPTMRKFIQAAIEAYELSIT